MKFNYKKISAVLTSGLMFGLTLGVAAAASMPAPFSDSSTSGVAVVTGTGMGVDDLTAAGNINDYLATQVKATGAAPTGDAIMLERSTDKFNLGDNMSAFYSKIDESELSTILAKGVYTNDPNNEYDYTQEIQLGVDLELTHFKNSDFNNEEPIIGFDLNADDLILNYTLKFSPTDADGVDSSWSGITNSYIPMLGEDYYVLAMTNASASPKITLLNAAVSGELTTGESTTVTAGGKTYEVVLVYNDGTDVKLEINGEATDSLQAASTYKLSDGSYIGIKDAQSEGYAGGAAYVEFSIGSGKLVLEDTKEVELNSDKLSKVKYPVANSIEEVQHEVTAFINTAGTFGLDSIVLEWKIQDDTWIAPGTELTLPGFESIKLSMEDFITVEPELTTLRGDSNRLTLKTTVTDGELDLDIFYLNSSSNGIEGLGTDSTHKLITSGINDVLINSTDNAGATGDIDSAIQLNLTETTHDFFVVTWISGDNAETYAYKLGEVDEDNNNATILESLTGGSDITIDAVGEYETEGNVKFTLTQAQENFPTKAWAVINITAASTGDVYTDRIVTAKGMQISLPVNNGSGATTGNGYLNLSAVPESWTMNFTEEDKDANIFGGPSFTMAMGFSGTDGIQPATLGAGLTSTTVYETEDNSDVWVGYMESNLATKVTHDKPTSGLDKLDVEYFGEESYAKAYVSEMSSTATEAGSMLFTDAEKSSWENRDVVLVGGSCINSATATALGVPANTCEAAFSAATGVTEGQYLIESVSGFTTGKIALVVAGYSQADTAAAASKLVNQADSIDTAVGNKYIGVLGTEGDYTMNKQ
jgi:hypothetical protein